MGKIFCENPSLSSVYSYTQPSEWVLAHQLYAQDQRSLFSKVQLPYKISRKRHPTLKHSFIVIPSSASPNGYLLGALSRGSLQHEGIISYGGMAIFKTITWENGEVSGVKIQDNPQLKNSREAYIYQQLGYPCFQFVRSYRTRKKDNHNHSPHDIWLHDKKIKDKNYLIIPIFPGIELFKFMKNHKTSLAEKAHIALNIAQSIKKIHDLNILHCDIKPENLIYDPSTQTIHVIDFGVSIVLKSFETHRVTHALRGTEGFIAPEILRYSHYSKASDIYSLGKTFLDMGLNEQDLNRFKLFDSPDQRPTIESLISQLEDFYHHIKEKNLSLASQAPVMTGLSLFDFKYQTFHSQPPKEKKALAFNEKKKSLSIHSLSDEESLSSLEPLPLLTPISPHLIFKGPLKTPSPITLTSSELTTFKPKRFKVYPDKH